MCAIVGSFDTDTLKMLIDLNSYRGQHSHSFSLFNPIDNIFTVLERELGPVRERNISIPKGWYGIVHI